MSNQRVSVATSTLLAIPATVLFTILLWQLRGLILVLMIAVVLAASIVPVVNWAERFQIPRWLSVVTVYLTLFAGLIGVAVLIGPAIADQIELLVSQLPVYTANFRALYETWINHLTLTRPELVRELFHPEALTTWAIRSSQQLILRSYGVTAGLLGGILSLILAIFISGYMVVDSKNLIQGLVRLFPQPWEHN